jgi:hypothetical protein
MPQGGLSGGRCWTGNHGINPRALPVRCGACVATTVTFLRRVPGAFPDHAGFRQNTWLAQRDAREELEAVGEALRAWLSL